MKAEVFGLPLFHFLKSGEKVVEDKRPAGRNFELPSKTREMKKNRQNESFSHQHTDLRPNFEKRFLLTDDAAVAEAGAAAATSGGEGLIAGVGGISAEHER